LCFYTAHGSIPSPSPAIINRTSSTNFSASCSISNFLLPNAANVSVYIELAINSYPFIGQYIIPGHKFFYTPTLWSSVQLITNLFCSTGLYYAYGQFIDNYYYAFNFSINGVMQLTNWTLPSQVDLCIVNFYIPLNGSYSYNPHTQFNYYSLLQKDENGDITTVYYYGITPLPTTFFINNTCPYIHPTNAPLLPNFPWWAWVLTIGGAAIIGGLLALIIIFVTRAWRASDHPERQHLVNN